MRLALHVASLWFAAATFVEVARASEGVALHAASLAAAAALWVRGRSRGADPRWMRASTALLAAYAIATVAAPKLVALTLGLSSLGTHLVARTREPGRNIGLLMLCACALPVVELAQALLGVPLRIASSALAALALRASGSPVRPLGVALTDGERTLFVDPACSGVSFLWSALFLAALLASALNLGWKRALALSAVAWLAILGANALRTAAAWMASELPRAELATPRAHRAVGLLCFALVAGALVACALRWRDARATTGGA